MKDFWYDHFVETLLAKYPKKTQLTQALTDLLCIEREAVYRRLRKDVAFPIHEIVKIASAWNISLDTVIGVNPGQVSFLMQTIDYLDPSTEHLNELNRRLQRLEHLKNYPDSEYLVVCNNLSRTFSSGFESLYKFNVFKWNYEYGGKEGTPLLFAQMNLTEEIREIAHRYYQLMKTPGHTSVIFDQMLFEYLVRDIKYFQSILLINEAEKELLKKELHELLEYLLDVANKGYYPETKRKVAIYISKVNINTNYSYFYTEKLKICRVHAFNKYDICTFDPEMLDSFRAWMQLKKRTSIQISEVDEKSRIEFFIKQHQLVDSL